MFIDFYRFLIDLLPPKNVSERSLASASLFVTGESSND